MTDLQRVKHRCLLFVTVLAGLKIILVVTRRIAPLDIGLAKGGKVTYRRLLWVRLMTVAALWNSLGLF